jgi:hypothetical protein
MLKLSMNDGEVETESDVFQVVSDKTPKRAMKALNKVSHALSTKAFRNVLKKLARHHH